MKYFESNKKRLDNHLGNSLVEASDSIQDMLAIMVIIWISRITSFQAKHV